MYTLHCNVVSFIFFRFSTAKKCSNEGRALMQLDYRHFVMKLERIAEIKPLPYQDHVVNYVKAYYIPEADLEQWVKIHEVFYFIFFHILLRNCELYSLT